MGEVGKSFLPLDDGFYGVIISRNGCTDTSACFEFRKPVPERPIRIYPTILLENTLNIDLGRIFQDVELNIYNSLGQLVYDKVYNDLNFIELNLPLASAVYYLSIKASEQEIQSFKFVKN